MCVLNATLPNSSCNKIHRNGAATTISTTPSPVIFSKQKSSTLFTVLSYGSHSISLSSLLPFPLLFPVLSYHFVDELTRNVHSFKMETVGK